MGIYVHTVTISGVDDSIRPAVLAELSLRYPHIEWGVLYSSSRLGTARYPSLGWLEDLKYCIDKSGTHARFSLHLCGSIAREVADGQPQLESISHLLPYFDRVQLNIGKLLKNVRFEALVDGIFKSTLRRNKIIVQVDSDALYSSTVECLRNLSMSYLFDSSGGKGVLSSVWPRAFCANCGYAGGLTPDNVAENLKKIDSINSSWYWEPTACPIWVDVESGIRTNDVFDITKVLSFVDAVDKGGYLARL